MPLAITIEDQVLPQLLTSALEAYDILHPNGKKKEDQLETFGLLWGYILMERPERDPRIVITAATIETSALRKGGGVTPSLDSLRMKADLVGRYWPHLEVVGTFHSHPYETRQEVIDCKGWQASTPETLGRKNEGDTIFWPYIHDQLFSYTPYLGHIIITVTSLLRSGWALPKQIEGDAGMEWSMGNRKLWIMGYATNLDPVSNESEMMNALPLLDVPALGNRIIEGMYKS
jgi:hypothetical protein